MSVTSLDLSVIWALIQWDRQCQDCNFGQVENYGFEFYGAQKLNGYMGNVQYVESQSSGQKRKEATSRQSGEMTDWRTQQREFWSLPASYKYLMDCLEAGPVNLRVEVMQSVGWWVSEMPLMLPHGLSTDKESLQTHQQRWVEATLPHINHSHHKFTQANAVFD